MRKRNNPRKRTYDVSGRRAAAAERQQAVIDAARTVFEQRGWAGTHLREIADSAGVSQKLVEAVFGTKSALLQAAVEYAIRGDIEPTPIARRERVAEMERAPDAATMLRLHAQHLRLINSRSAHIAAVVEQAAAADPAVGALWQQMNHNRDDAITWATNTLLTKRGRRRGLTRPKIASILWVALDWGTYRTLTEHAGLNDDGYQTWLHNFYKAMLLPASP